MERYVQIIFQKDYHLARGYHAEAKATQEILRDRLNVKIPLYPLVLLSLQGLNRAQVIDAMEELERKKEKAPKTNNVQKNVRSEMIREEVREKEEAEGEREEAREASTCSSVTNNNPLPQASYMWNPYFYQTYPYQPPQGIMPMMPMMPPPPTMPQVQPPVVPPSWPMQAPTKPAGSQAGFKQK